MCPKALKARWDVVEQLLELDEEVEVCHRARSQHTNDKLNKHDSNKTDRQPTTNCKQKKQQHRRGGGGLRNVNLKLSELLLICYSNACMIAMYY